MRKFLIACCLLTAALPAYAQRIQIIDLLRYLRSPIGAFEQSMFRQGFVCYQS